MRRSITLLLTVVLVALLAACGGDDEPVRSGDGPTDRPDGGGGGASPEPGGRDDGLFLSIEVGGGFVMVGHDFKTVPRAVVLADGTTFTGGAVMEIYPGPAVLPVVEGQIDDGELAELMAAAQAAGLVTDEEPDFGEPPIADAATTTITVVADGQTYTTSVYALQDAGAGLPGMDEQPGIDEDAAAARERVAAFVDEVSRMVTEAEEGLWEPDRFRVLAMPTDPGAEPQEGIEPDVRDWPFPEAPLVERECLALEGDRAEQFAEVVADATEITQWHSDGGAYQLFIRPVFPHEPGCPE